MSLSDNRAASEVNLVGKKRNLKAAALNSVAFKFNMKARLDLGTVVDEDMLMELCLENGVDDYELRTEVNGSPLNPSEDGKCCVYVDTKDMAIMRDTLRGKNIQLETSLARVPIDDVVTISDEDFEANMAAIDAFEALDDVDSVEHNIDMVGEDDE